jgi:hypothetical protein
MPREAASGPRENVERRRSVLPGEAKQSARVRLPTEDDAARRRLGASEQDSGTLRQALDARPGRTAAAPIGALGTAASLVRI